MLIQTTFRNITWNLVQVNFIYCLSIYTFLKKEPFGNNQNICLMMRKRISYSTSIQWTNRQLHKIIFINKF